MAQATRETVEPQTDPAPESAPAGGLENLDVSASLRGGTPLLDTEVKALELRRVHGDREHRQRGHRSIEKIAVRLNLAHARVVIESCRAQDLVASLTWNENDRSRVAKASGVR